MELISLGLSLESRTSLNNPSVQLSDVANLGWLMDGPSTDAGEVINEQTALKISTVFTCLRVLSESVSSLPVQLLRVTPQGRMQELENPLAYLFGVAPNVEMNSCTFFDTLTFQLMLTGNAYAEIQRSDDGSPVALWPLLSRLTAPVRMPNGELAYETADGEIGGKRRVLTCNNILHVPLMSADGIVGMSPITMAARSLGLAAAATRYGARFFANNATPSGILSTIQRVKPEDKAKMRTEWEAMQLGGNRHRIAVLDQELTYARLGISPEEAQFLETRIHERSEICALFRVPVHMCGSEQKLSNSNVEQLNLAFITDSLRPILTRFEAELVRKLLPRTPGSASTLTFRFDISERQRGDTAAQVSLIAAGRQWGALTANDVLRMLGLPVAGPSEDIRLAPLNMQNADRLLDLPTVPDRPLETVVRDAA